MEAHCRIDGLEESFEAWTISPGSPQSPELDARKNPEISIETSGKIEAKLKFI